MTGIVLTIDFPPSIGATASLVGGTCSNSAGQVECRLPVLAPGATATGTLALTGQSAGTVTVRARVAGAYFDPATANDLAELTIDFTPAPASRVLAGAVAAR